MSAAVAVFGIALLAALLYAVLEKQAPAMHFCSPLGQRWCCWCGQGQASGQYFPA